MKKTLIAAGIAAVVAAPAAFADVKVGGVVEQAFTFNDVGENDATSDNAVSFSASEDLGNGLSAFAFIMLDTDDNTTKDEKVGLKGSFGTLTVGRMENFTEGKLMSRMTMTGDGSASGGLVENGSGQSNASRNDGAIAYNSPSMNGFSFGAAGYVLADGTTYNNDTFDAMDFALFYDNGPLSVAASQERTKFAAGTQKVTVLTASYKMGDAKATILRHDVDSNDGTSGQDSTDMMYRLDYKMGANTLSVAFNDDEEETTGANGTDIWAVELVHNFSKRTAAYINYADIDAAAGANDSEMTIGMYHKF